MKEPVTSRRCRGLHTWWGSARHAWLSLGGHGGAAGSPAKPPGAGILDPSPPAKGEVPKGATERWRPWPWSQDKLGPRGLSLGLRAVSSCPQLHGRSKSEGHSAEEEIVPEVPSNMIFQT